MRVRRGDDVSGKKGPEEAGQERVRETESPQPVPDGNEGQKAPEVRL